MSVRLVLSGQSAPAINVGVDGPRRARRTADGGRKSPEPCERLWWLQIENNYKPRWTRRVCLCSPATCCGHKESSRPVCGLLIKRLELSGRLQESPGRGAFSVFFWPASSSSSSSLPEKLCSTFLFPQDKQTFPLVCSSRPGEETLAQFVGPN